MLINDFTCEHENCSKKGKTQKCIQIPMNIEKYGHICKECNQEVDILYINICLECLEKILKELKENV